MCCFRDMRRCTVGLGFGFRMWVVWRLNGAHLAAAFGQMREGSMTVSVLVKTA